MPFKPKNPELTLAEKIAANHIPGDPDACWPWLGARNSSGYGSIVVRLEGKGSVTMTASRAMMILLGHDVTGKCVCHHCDNPPCVNPAHLFVGTQQENILDMRRKGRWRSVRLRKLTDGNVREIRESDAPVGELAKKYGVSTTTIYNVVAGRRKSWVETVAPESTVKPPPWEAKDLLDWRERQQFTRAAAAAHLDVDEATLYRMEKTGNPIDTRTRLACMAISLGLR